MKKSKLFRVTAYEFLKGLAFSAIAACIGTAEEYIATGELFKKESLIIIGKSAAIGAITYIVKKFTTNSDGQILTKEDTSNYVGGKKS